MSEFIEQYGVSPLDSLLGKTIGSLSGNSPDLIPYPYQLTVVGKLLSDIGANSPQYESELKSYRSIYNDIPEELLHQFTNLSEHNDDYTTQMDRSVAWIFFLAVASRSRVCVEKMYLLHKQRAINIPDYAWMYAAYLLSEYRVARVLNFSEWVINDKFIIKNILSDNKVQELAYFSAYLGSYYSLFLATIELDQRHRSSDHDIAAVLQFGIFGGHPLVFHICLNTMTIGEEYIEEAAEKCKLHFGELAEINCIDGVPVRVNDLLSKYSNPGKIYICVEH
jgi:hypothetical protein